MAATWVPLGSQHLPGYLAPTTGVRIAYIFDALHARQKWGVISERRSITCAADRRRWRRPLVGHDTAQHVRCASQWRAAADSARQGDVCLSGRNRRRLPPSRHRLGHDPRRGPQRPDCPQLFARLSFHLPAATAQCLDGAGLVGIGKSKANLTNAAGRPSLLDPSAS